MLDYGYRSKCCYAPIRLGRKKLKGTNIKVNVWVCVRCHKRDCDIVEYIKKEDSQSSEAVKKMVNFIPDDETDY